MTTKLPSPHSIAAVAVAMLLGAAATGCSMLHDDLDPCPQGLDVSFDYSYNLEGKDRFAQSTGSVTAYVYDKDGRFVTKQQLAVDPAGDNVMHIDLQPGQYRVFAVASEGGAGNAKLYTPVNAGSYTDFSLKLERNGAGTVSQSDKKLDHAWMTLRGKADLVTVYEGDEGLLATASTTVSLMRLTNNLEITMSQIDFPTYIDPADFEIKITDRNGLIGYDNTLLPDDELTYLPYEQSVVDDAAVEGKRNLVSHINFSRVLHNPGRATKSTGPVLTITDKKNGHTQEYADFTDWLLLCQEAYGTNFGAQEFLDRCHDFKMSIGVDGAIIKYVQLEVDMLSWSKRIYLVDF